MGYRHASRGHDFLNHGGNGINRLHGVMDKENLTFTLQLQVDGASNDAPAELHHYGLNRQAVPGGSLNNGEVAKSNERHIQAARNGSSG